jgi:hypothetical protein
MFVFLVVMEMYVHVINYSHCIPIIAKMADLRLEAQGQARQSTPDKPTNGTSVVDAGGKLDNSVARDVENVRSVSSVMPCHRSDLPSVKEQLEVAKKRKTTQAEEYRKKKGFEYRQKMEKASDRKKELDKEEKERIDREARVEQSKRTAVLERKRQQEEEMMRRKREEYEKRQKQHEAAEERRKQQVTKTPTSKIVMHHSSPQPKRSYKAGPKTSAEVQRSPKLSKKQQSTLSFSASTTKSPSRSSPALSHAVKSSPSIVSRHPFVQEPSSSRTIHQDTVPTGVSTGAQKPPKLSKVPKSNMSFDTFAMTSTSQSHQTLSHASKSSPSIVSKSPFAQEQSPSLIVLQDTVATEVKRHSSPPSTHANQPQTSKGKKDSSISQLPSPSTSKSQKLKQESKKTPTANRSQEKVSQSSPSVGAKARIKKTLSHPKQQTSSPCRPRRDPHSKGILSDGKEAARDSINTRRAQHGSATGDVNEKKPTAPSGNVFTKKSPDWSKKKQNGSKNTSPNENGNTNGNDNEGLKGTASVKQLDKDIVEKERHEAEDELTAMKLEVETLGEPVVERVTEPVVESVVEKVTEAGERVVEPVMKPTVKQVVEPVGEPVVDVMVEPVGDPVVDVMVEPVMKKALTKADIQPEETGVNATKNVPKRITSATEIFFAERSTSLVVPDFSSRRYSDGATRTRKRGIVLDQPPMLPPGAWNPQTFVPSSSSVNQMEKVAEQGIQKGFSPDESRPEDGRSGSEKESEDDDKVEENAKRAVRRALIDAIMTQTREEKVELENMLKNKNLETPVSSAPDHTEPEGGANKDLLQKPNALQRMQSVPNILQDSDDEKEESVVERVRKTSAPALLTKKSSVDFEGLEVCQYGGRLDRLPSFSSLESLSTDKRHSHTQQPAFYSPSIFMATPFFQETAQENDSFYSYGSSDRDTKAHKEFEDDVSEFTDEDEEPTAHGSYTLPRTHWEDDVSCDSGGESEVHPNDGRPGVMMDDVVSSDEDDDSYQVKSGIMMDDVVSSDDDDDGYQIRSGIMMDDVVSSDEEDDSHKVFPSVMMDDVVSSDEEDDSHKVFPSVMMDDVVSSDEEDDSHKVFPSVMMNDVVSSDEDDTYQVRSGVAMDDVVSSDDNDDSHQTGLGAIIEDVISSDSETDEDHAVKHTFRILPKKDSFILFREVLSPTSPSEDESGPISDRSETNDEINHLPPINLPPPPLKGILKSPRPKEVPAPTWPSKVSFPDDEIVSSDEDIETKVAILPEPQASYDPNKQQNIMFSDDVVCSSSSEDEGPDDTSLHFHVRPTILMKFDGLPGGDNPQSLTKQVALDGTPVIQPNRGLFFEDVICSSDSDEDDQVDAPTSTTEVNSDHTPTSSQPTTYITTANTDCNAVEFSDGEKASKVLPVKTYEDDVLSSGEEEVDSGYPFGWSVPVVRIQHPSISSRGRSESSSEEFDPSFSDIPAPKSVDGNTQVVDHVSTSDSDTGFADSIPSSTQFGDGSGTFLSDEVASSSESDGDLFVY